MNIVDLQNITYFILEFFGTKNQLTGFYFLLQNVLLLSLFSTQSCAVFLVLFTMEGVLVSLHCIGTVCHGEGHLTQDCFFILWLVKEEHIGHHGKSAMGMSCFVETMSGLSKHISFLLVILSFPEVLTTQF